MKKKVFGMIIMIILIVVISIMLSMINKSPVINATTVIQDQKFEATVGYSEVNKTINLTNDKQNFKINGQVVPPAIRVKPKTQLNVKVVNNSEFETSIHFHGVNGNSNMDGVGGVTQQNIKPGQQFTYRFNLDDAGTYMYHSHVDTANQINNENLYGGLVVEQQTATNSDMLFFNTNITNLEEHHTANQTFDQVLINGNNTASLQVNNDQNIFLNVVNISSTPLSINFGKDIKYKITSVDANPTTSEWISNTSVTVPTAQRFIVEIENPKHSFQISSSLKSKTNGTYNVYYKNSQSIDEVNFNQPVNQMSMANTELNNLADDSQLIYDLVTTIEDIGVSDKRPDVKEKMVLDMTNNMWTIDNKAFPDADAIDVEAGDIVEITLTNNSHMAETHPFHLHGHKFQVMEVNGEKVAKNIVLDTINVEPGNEVTIRFNADNPGIWAFHCHNLVHAAKGMVTTVNYQGYSTNVQATASE